MLMANRIIIPRWANPGRIPRLWAFIGLKVRVRNGR